MLPRGVDPHTTDGHTVADLIFRDEDATFIAEARGDVPDLLAIVASLPKCMVDGCAAFATWDIDGSFVACDVCSQAFRLIRPPRELHYAAALRAFGGAT